MIRHNLLLVLILLVIAFNLPVGVQDSLSATFTTDIGSPRIGEPISLLLTIRVPVGAVIRLPELTTDWPPFMILDVGEVTMISSDGHDSYQQHFTVVLWRPGDYQTPETVVDYQVVGSDEYQSVKVQAVYFSVKSILNPDDLSLRPLKPPIWMPYISVWFLGAVFLGSAITAIYGWRIWKKFRQNRLVVVEMDGLHPSARIALADLRRIAGGSVAPVKVYTIAGNAIRQYIQERFGIKAGDMTTDELVTILGQGSELSERRLRELAFLLEQADLVKFARFQPQPKSAARLVDMGLRWIMAVERHPIEDMG